MVRRTLVAIPTRNRPRLVGELLACLAQQSSPPDAIVICDSSDPAERRELFEVVASAGPEGSQLPEVITTEVRSLPYQRRAVAERVLASPPSERPDYVLFLDDDVRPSADYLERLKTLLEGDVVGVIGGVSGVSQWERGWTGPLYRALRVVFALESAQEGALLSSGIGVPVPSTSLHPVRADWLFGCSMWRSEVFESHVWLGEKPGSALFEDVEFSARVGRDYQLWVDPAATLHHGLAVAGRPDAETLERDFVRYRWDVVQNAIGSRRARAAFWWATSGEALLLGRHAFPGNALYRRRLRGLANGVADVVGKRARP